MCRSGSLTTGRLVVIPITLIKLAFATAIQPLKTLIPGQSGDFFNGIKA